MKKNVWAKMLSLMLVFVCVMGLAACGGNDGGDTSAAGYYRLQTLEIAGLSMDLEQLAETSGVSADELKVGLDLKSDGSFILDMSAVDPSQSLEGTWEASGSTIKLTVEGETIDTTLADGVITMSEESQGITMTFKK